LAPIGHYHCDIDAALPADDLIGGLKTKRVNLNLLRIRRNQFHMRLGIGKSPCIVLATECALTCAKHLVAWLPTCCQLDEYGPAVTLTLEDQMEISSLTLRRRSNLGSLKGTTRLALLSMGAANQSAYGIIDSIGAACRTAVPEYRRR
jgi:hypothetical protein